MLLLSPQEKLKKCVAEINNMGIDIQFSGDKAVYVTSKTNIDVEVSVIGSKPCIRLYHRKTKGRDEAFNIILPLLRKNRLFKDTTLSTDTVPTYSSKDVPSDFNTMRSIIEKCEDLVDSNKSWKTNAGLEDGTMFIVRSIMLAAELGHSSALGRDMYESIRGQVSINKYDSSLGLTYGEHLSPIDWLNQTGYEMAKRGATEKEVYEFIMKFHKVAYITPDQAALLDSVHKTTMPENAKDAYARINEANVGIVGLKE